MVSDDFQWTTILNGLSLGTSLLFALIFVLILTSAAIRLKKLSLGLLAIGTVVQVLAYLPTWLYYLYPRGDNAIWIAYGASLLLHFTGMLIGLIGTILLVLDFQRLIANQREPFENVPILGTPFNE